jgi:predicted deacylase
MSNLITPKSGDISQGSSAAPWQPWDRKDGIVQQWITLSNSYSGSYESIGKNMKGWDIVLFKFGNPNGGKIFIDSHLHGNEQYGHQLLISIIKWVLSSSDPNAIRIRERNQILVVPCINYRWARTNYNIPSWMGTTKDADGGKYGVNLNRNFSPTWSSSLSHVTTDSYSGVAADSELESKALIAAWNKYKPRIYYNLHQGTGPSTSCVATSTQAVTDLSKVKSLYTTIALTYGITPYTISTSNGGQGFAQDGASKIGSAAFMSEVMSGWDFTAAKKTSLTTGDNFQKFRALFIAMCQTVEINSPTNPCQSYIDRIAELEAELLLLKGS